MHGSEWKARSASIALVCQKGIWTCLLTHNDVTYKEQVKQGNETSLLIQRLLSELASNTWPVSTTNKEHSQLQQDICF